VEGKLKTLVSIIWIAQITAVIVLGKIDTLTEARTPRTSQPPKGNWNIGLNSPNCWKGAA